MDTFTTEWGAKYSNSPKSTGPRRFGSDKKEVSVGADVKCDYDKESCLRIGLRLRRQLNGRAAPSKACVDPATRVANDGGSNPSLRSIVSSGETL